MITSYVLILTFALFLTGLYFLPYKKLRGKVFNRLLSDPSNLVAMEYKTKAYSLELEKRSGVWYIIDSDWEADKQKVTKLINRLRDLNIEDRIEGNPDNPKFNIGCNGYLILDYLGNKSVTISIGNRLEDDDSSVYITKTGLSEILVVTANSLSLLPKDIESFSDTQIFDAFFPQVQSIEASFKKEFFSLLNTEEGWMLDGKSYVRDEIAQQFIETILRTEAKGFVEEDDVKIPQRPIATISLKVNRKSVTRYFFTNSEKPDVYLMPLRGRILYVDKSIVRTVFSFNGKSFYGMK